MVLSECSLSVQSMFNVDQAKPLLFGGYDVILMHRFDRIWNLLGYKPPSTPMRDELIG